MTEKHFGLIRSISLKILALQEHRAQEIQVKESSLKDLDKIIENQFRFHYDTVLIKKCPHVLHPNDLISITSKVHGTSGISAYVLCKQELNWKQKIARWLTGEEFDKYDYLYSSRSVIKKSVL